VRLILASTSASRAAMLEAASVPFEAVAPRIDERGVEADLGDITPVALAATLAQKKALAVQGGGDTLVLGSDSVLEAPSGATLSKPDSPETLRGQLRTLGGGSHRLISAAAVAQDGDIVWRATEIVTMHMRPLSESFIDEYVAREWEQARWCVGGYRVEALGIQLFERIEGSHFAVLGLPLLPLLSFLRERGVLPS
jgi:septum formation protein